MIAFICCKNNEKNICEVSNDCVINYSLEDGLVSNLEIIKDDVKIILYFPSKDQIQLSLNQSKNKCNVILDSKFYSFEIGNQDNHCAVNNNDKFSSFDLRNKENFRTVAQYFSNEHIVEHYEQIENCEIKYSISKDGIVEK